LTEPEIEVRKENAERTGTALRSALGSGFVPGGGIAYLNCRAALQAAIQPDDPFEKRAAFRIIMHALEEPVRTLLTNAGVDLEEWLGPIKQAPAGSGMDLRTQKICNLAEAGVIDSAEVAKSVLKSAVSTAALALTVDVLVHHRNPPQSYQP
jgi:chaperonin GroEL